VSCDRKSDQRSELVSARIATDCNSSAEKGLHARRLFIVLDLSDSVDNPIKEAKS
jgi:hypothetical protein